MSLLLLPLNLSRFREGQDPPLQSSYITVYHNTRSADNKFPAEKCKQNTKNPHHVSVVRISSVLLQAKTLVEAINTSTGVNQLLLAGIERVALGADLNTNVLLGRTGSKDIAASAADGGLFVVGMDTFLHFVHLFRIS